MMCQAVADEGHQVVSAANGQEALDRLREKPTPCVVVTDLMMPIMSGWKLIDMLRDDPSTARIPIVVVSAAQPAKVPGGYPVFAKPIDLEKVIRTINAVYARD
jgi:CheY-like chemotaxis protein